MKTHKRAVYRNSIIHLKTRKRAVSENIGVSKRRKHFRAIMNTETCVEVKTHIKHGTQKRASDFKKFKKVEKVESNENMNLKTCVAMKK